MERAKKEKARLQSEIKAREKHFREAAKKKEQAMKRLQRTAQKELLQRRKLQQKLQKQANVSRQKDTQINILKNKVKAMEPKRSSSRSKPHYMAPLRRSTKDGSISRGSGAQTARLRRSTGRKRGSGSLDHLHTSVRSPKFRRIKS